MWLSRLHWKTLLQSKSTGESASECWKGCALFWDAYNTCSWRGGNLYFTTVMANPQPDEIQMFRFKLDSQ